MEVRLTHIGGPTALIEVGGWRCLTDPTCDTVLYDGVGQVAERLAGQHRAAPSRGCALPISGPVRYTMTAKEAIELCQLVQPRTGREAIERQLANAPEDVRERIRWLPIGVATGLA